MLVAELNLSLKLFSWDQFGSTNRAKSLKIGLIVAETEGLKLTKMKDIF
jgi:hypothetical protein